MSAIKARRSAYKVTDFRRELQYREKKVAEIKREQMKIFADIRPVPRYVITIDLSHARGNMDALKQGLRELGWKEYPFGRKDQHCDVHWHCVNFEQNLDVYGGRVNKFPGMSWICSKMNVFRVLDQMRRLYPDEYDFYPRTWYLPEQLNEFVADVRRLHEKKVKPKPTFIIKPDEGSQGEGIYLLRDPQEYMFNNGRIHVAQEYLSNVYILDKFKFDLRVYVMLKSVDPLEIYICKEGLARFSTVPYESPTNRNMHETFMHLTNYSLNKRSTTFNRSERDDEGSKRTLTSVFNRLARMGHNVDIIWDSIERMITKTMIALIPDVKIELISAIPQGKPGPSCFQILGFDILLMHDLKPMLLEINGSPSLRIDCEQEVAPGIMEYMPSLKDEEVKVPLIRDALLLVAPQSKLKYMNSQKRRRERREKKRQQREEKENRRREKQLKQGIHQRQKEMNGVIYVETNHPRSSIIIIRADDDGQKEKEQKLEKEKTETDLMDRLKLTEEGEITEGSDVNEAGNPSDESGNTEDSNAEDTNRDSDGGERKSEDLDNSEDDGCVYDAAESCLKQLYPDPHEEEYDKLRLYEKLAEIFMISRGVRSTQRLGPTGFRTFSRKCRLNKKGLTNAALDILFIDMQRKWEHVNPERTTGLCFRGFLDACHEIARRKFFSGSRLEMMEDMIEYCELNLLAEQQYQAKTLPRLQTRRQRQHNFPSLGSGLALAEDNPYIRQHTFMQPQTANDVETFLKLRRKKRYMYDYGGRRLLIQEDNQDDE